MAMELSKFLGDLEKLENKIKEKEKRLEWVAGAAKGTIEKCQELDEVNFGEEIARLHLDRSIAEMYTLT